MNNITVIPTTADHLQDICDIEKLCFSTPWSANSFLYGLNTPDTQSYFTALCDGKVVGYICTFHLFEEGELLNIAVRPDVRKMGIAQRLIDKMYETMLKKDVQRITLEVRKSNNPAISLYEKNGFSPIAVRKNYYTSPLEDGIVMEKHI